MKAFACFASACAIATAQLPEPPPPGRQYPYVSTVTVLGTSVVTTVYEVKYMRLVDAGQAGRETNFVALRTNAVSVTTTNAAGQPQ